MILNLFRDVERPGTRLHKCISNQDSQWSSPTYRHRSRVANSCHWWTQCIVTRGPRTRLSSCKQTLLPCKYKAIPVPLGGAPESGIEISSQFVHQVPTWKQGWPDHCVPARGEKQTKHGGQRGGYLLHPFLASCSTWVHNVSVSSTAPAGTLGP